MSRPQSALTGLIFLAMTGAASAAILTGVEGSVLVSRLGPNAAFVPAVNGTELKPGDMVLANNGRARLIYSSDCAIDLLPNLAFEIPASSPCLQPSGAANNPALAGIGLGGLLIGIGLAAEVSIGAGLVLLNHPDSN